MVWGEPPAAECGEEERDGGGLQEEQALLSLVCIGGTDFDIVDSYKYLGVVLDNKLEWTTNTETVYKKGLSRLYFLRRLRSFNVCNQMLQMSLLSQAPSSSLWCPGVQASKRRMQTD